LIHFVDQARSRRVEERYTSSVRLASLETGWQQAPRARVRQLQQGVHVHDSGMSKGDRVDVQARCLFAFIAKGCDTKARKRARQPAADAVRDLLAEDDQEFLPANNGGRAAGGGAVDDGRHRGDADYTRPKRDRGRDRRRAKNGGSHYVGREDHSNLFPTNDGVHAWAGGFQEDYGFCKPDRRREDDKASSWYLDATPEEIEAAKGLLMLKYALLAQRRYY
jgi:hypothetical protein